MRIAIYSEVYTPDKNGVATHTRTLKDGLERLGHEALVVAADKHTRRHAIDRDNVLRCPARGMRRVYGFGLSAPVSMRRLDLAHLFGPDVIHMQSEFSMGISGIIASRKLNLPLIYTVHTMYDDTYIHYVVPRPLVGVAKKVLYRYLRYLTDTATAVIVPSNRAQQFLLEDIQADARKFHCIPNAVDWQRFDPSQLTEAERAGLHSRLGTSPQRRTAVFVGRLGKEKGLDVLLAWWAQQMKMEDNWQLVLVGGGPEADSLRAMANDLGIAAQVAFAGTVEHAEVRKYLALSDVFVTASLTENNSISMLEAMASGLMVLQRYDEGTADQIAVGINGDFFENSAQMAEKLRAMGCLSEAEMALQKQRVRASVKCLDTREMVKKTLAVYHEAIATHQGDLELEMARTS